MFLNSFLKKGKDEYFSVNVGVKSKQSIKRPVFNAIAFCPRKSFLMRKMQEENNQHNTIDTQIVRQ